jgi:hypothetical protein
MTKAGSGSVARQTTPRVRRRDGGVPTTAEVQASRQSREAALARRAVGECAACGRAEALWRVAVGVADARADMPPEALSPTCIIASCGWCRVERAPAVRVELLGESAWKAEV